MRDLHVRLESLEPMRVAAVHVISPTPEADALRRLRAWADARDPARLAVGRLFGFNHPSPPPGHRDYGYELWLEVDSATPPDPAIVLKDFPGGLYAATTCRLQGDPAGTIGEVWRKLWAWTQAGDYRWRHTHELEHPLNPLAAAADLVLDLFLPVEPRPAPLPAPAPTPLLAHRP